MRQQLESFVRGTLGCQCPDAVFASIETSPLQSANCAASGTRLLIGERLLLYVVADPPEQGIDDCVASLLAQGRTERDAHGYNRFRLVLGSEDPGRIQAAAQARFSAGAGGDARLHLHVVARQLLPPLDEAASTRSSRAGTCLCQGVPARKSRCVRSVSSLGATPARTIVPSACR